MVKLNNFMAEPPIRFFPLIRQRLTRNKIMYVYEDLKCEEFDP